ncbi:MAG: glucose-6-phosphate dehydrogenase [Firmicutes bacterium]|nr:glucose-6-phosphate dehydrogenase [Bacillota bacterium]
MRAEAGRTGQDAGAAANAAANEGPGAAAGAAPPCTVVIFGATGDLAQRKLFPALYGLHRDGLLDPRTQVVGVGRREKTPEQFRCELQEYVWRFSRLAAPARQAQSPGVGVLPQWEDFARRFHYFRLEMHDAEGYGRLQSFLEELEQAAGVGRRRIFYLAVMPDLFGIVTGNLRQAGLLEAPTPAPDPAAAHGAGKANGTAGLWPRLVIEKPFGYDLESAARLNREIRQAFPEDAIYRIDHYLGKEMTQNISVIRFANTIFEPVWNRNYIDHIQIMSTETVGVENRGEYYDRAGALRDMVQNHMLQLVALVAMEPPSSLESEAVRDEKVKILRSLVRWQTPREVARNAVRGQYGPGRVAGQDVPGYRSEPEVRPDSRTETFAAMRLFVDNFRWADVPFYLRTGKRLGYKATEIAIQFKQLPRILYFHDYGGLQPNRLVIRIQPVEGVYFQINAKQTGTQTEMMPVAMDFCRNCGTTANSPEAYERLLFDVMRGDATLFTRWDEVSLAWEFVDPIARAWEQTTPDFPNYPAGSWGPEAARNLLHQDGRSWWPE